MAIFLPKDPLASAIPELLQTLLSEKHLYQSLTLNTDYIDELIKNSQDAITTAAMPSTRPSPSASDHRELIKKRENARLAQPWVFKAHGIEVKIIQSNELLIPNIKTFCHQCSERQAFSPLQVSENTAQTAGSQTVQKWLFSFLCQGCQDAQVDFLIQRDNQKVMICGRSPLEAIPAPADIPKKFRKQYSSAVVAANAGQVLAGLFLLRVFIEQFWHSTPVVQELLTKSARTTGDEMGSAYKTTLPDDFKGRFPTLLEVYNELSEAMHTAQADSKLFQSACARIVEHFEARRLFRLNTTSS